MRPRLALPDRYHLPAGETKVVKHGPIALDVPDKLLFPERDIRLRGARKTAPRMPVPETTVNKDRRSRSAYHNIRRASQLRDVQSVSITKLP